MRSLMAAVVAAAVAGLGGSALAGGFNPGTDARLQNPEPENWLTWRGNYEGWGHSPLNQINAGNVGNLVPV